MSYVVNTSTVGIYRGQDRPGGVAVTVGGIPALVAPEDSVGEPEPLLGYREATRTRHRRVSGRHQHHPPARPHATLNKLTLGHTDRSISRFPSHRGPGQKQRPEVFNRDGVMGVDDPASPGPSGVDVLPRSLLVDLRRLPLGPLVTLRRRLSARPAATAQLPLRLGKFGGAPAAMPAEGKIEHGVGGRGGRGDAPVDPDRTVRVGRGLAVAAHHERGVPVPETVAVDTHAGGVRGKFAGPHHRYGDATGQAQPVIPDREPRVVYSNDGNAFFRALNVGLPHPLTLNEWSSATA